MKYLVALVALAIPRSALAGECTIAADADLAGQIREALATGNDLDDCAHIEVTGRRVRVTLHDGRSASRAIARREDVLPTIEALLLVPRAPDPAAEPVAEPSPLPAPAPILAPAPAPAPLPAFAEERAPIDRVAPASKSAPPSHPHVELGLLSGGRFADTQKSAQLALLSFVEMNGWLVGASARFERYLVDAGGPQGTSGALALLAGRRFRGSSVTYDLYGGALFAFENQSTEVFENPIVGRRVQHVDARVIPRLIVGGRVNFRAQSVLRTFVGIDCDFGRQGGEGIAPSSDAHLLPHWSAGLSVGAAVGSL